MLASAAALGGQPPSKVGSGGDSWKLGQFTLFTCAQGAPRLSVVVPEQAGKQAAFWKNVRVVSHAIPLGTPQRRSGSPGRRRRGSLDASVGTPAASATARHPLPR